MSDLRQSRETSAKCYELNSGDNPSVERSPNTTVLLDSERGNSMIGLSSSPV